MNFELVPNQNISMTTGATIHTTNVMFSIFIFIFFKGNFFLFILHGSPDFNSGLDIHIPNNIMHCSVGEISSQR